MYLGVQHDHALRPLQGYPHGHHDHGAGGQGGDQLREDWLQHGAGVQVETIPGRWRVDQRSVWENQDRPGDHRCPR